MRQADLSVMSLAALAQLQEERAVRNAVRIEIAALLKADDRLIGARSEAAIGAARIEAFADRAASESRPAARSESA